MLGVMSAVDLNIDMGEGGAHDEALLALASSANIACGGHAGGGEMMRTAIRQAQAAGVAVGAHPGYADRANFGRVETGESVQVVVEEVRRQLGDFCSALGGMPHHVKLHGALYHRVDRDGELAEALTRLIATFIPEARVYAFAGGGFARAAMAAYLEVWREGFIDRGYGRDGRLIPRGEPGAGIGCVEKAAAQAVRLVASGNVETLCVHGDGEAAVAVLKAARSELLARGWRI